ncbi:MAG TPA: c-type cytochrome [Candidatus Acidoferrales bacterium]|nr:c-type cytochrome [Candidatus Acidoferrales bacterium]
MLRKFLLLIVLIIIVLIAGGWFVFDRMTISALDQPSRLEVFLATQAKHRLVARAALESLPTETPANADTIEDGHTSYGSSCAGCHGYDGRTPTKLGASLYPHAPSLASADVQMYNDRELYVIIHNGIRLSGMPAFGNSQTSDQIWNLIHYVRTLPSGQPGRR